MSIIKVIQALDRLEVKLVFLLLHSNADPDAICSAYALKSLLKQLRPHLKIRVVASQGLSRLSKHLLKHLFIKVETQANVENADVFILLDTNTIQQLNRLAETVLKLKAPIIVIDHHASHPETDMLSTLSITHEQASSTCEIVYDFFNQMGVTPSREESRALFLGMAFDTRHFAIAKSSAFKVIAELIEIGVDAQETLALLSMPMDLSERVARLKASRRARTTRIGEWIIAFSSVSTYQASAARAMIGLGAHIAVVAGQRNESIQISLRSTPEFHSKTCLHLGRDIARPLGEYLHGMGGGHSTAAGVNGLGNVERGLKRCLRLIKEVLDDS